MQLNEKLFNSKLNRATRVRELYEISFSCLFENFLTTFNDRQLDKSPKARTKNLHSAIKSPLSLTHTLHKPKSPNYCLPFLSDFLVNCFRLFSVFFAFKLLIYARLMDFFLSCWDDVKWRRRDVKKVFFSSFVDNFRMEWFSRLMSASFLILESLRSWHLEALVLKSSVFLRRKSWPFASSLHRTNSKLHST